MSKSLIALLRGASPNRRAFRARVAQLQNQSASSLEPRTLLSAATFTLSGSVLTVRGSNLGESLTVQDNGSTVEIDCDGTLIDTGASEGSLSFIRLFGLGGDDTLTIDGSIDPAINAQIFGGDGNDTLVGNAGDNLLRGNAGVDSYDGGDGDDRFNIGSADAGFLGGDGYDRATYVADDGAGGLNIVSGDLEYVAGSDSDDTIDLSAQTVNTVILGNGGVDTLTGGTGNDTLRGGDGDDVLSGGDGNDNLLGEAGADDLDGGAGNDRTAYNNSPAGVEVDLAAGTGVGGDAGGDTFTSIENVTGSGFDDVLLGDATGNVLFGLAGNDVLEGRGAGDRLGGGTGIDTVTYESSAAAVRADLAARAYVGGDATGDILGGVENLIGTAFNDTLGGDTLDNLLIGLGGNDSINGREGIDTIFGDNAAGAFAVGAEGNDTIAGGDGGDFVDAEGGNNVVRADQADFDSGALAAGGGVDRLILVGAGSAAGGGVTASVGGLGFEFVDGSALGDDISAAGSAVGLTISGLGGDDVILGGDGDDILNGGVGNDNIGGGLGADLLRGNGGDDTLSGNELGSNTADGSTDRLFGGGGADTAYQSTDPEFISADTETVI